MSKSPHVTMAPGPTGSNPAMRESTIGPEAGLDLVEQLNDALAGRYEIERELGRGAMATVYLARELRPARQVAIKVLDPALGRQLGQERFLREVDIASNLVHPHIVPIFAAGEAAGLLYYVMPYIEGRSVRARLTEQGPLPLGDAIAIIRDVAKALDHAHRRNVVHRDIKPANILLVSGHAIVADFGIARAICTSCPDIITTAGAFVGTPGYMSPEQASGMVDLDGRSDIYSLACVLHEMLYGEPPFPGTTCDVFGQPKVEDVASGQDGNDTMPYAIKRVLCQALAASAEIRHRSVGEFAAAIADAHKEEGWGVDQPHSSTVSSPSASLTAIAVLPFPNVGSDANNDSFADGLTNEIIRELTRCSSLEVASRATVSQYRDPTKNLRELGTELTVAAVLEGSVRRLGDRVRIISQLIDVVSDTLVWSQTFDRDLAETGDIPGEVAGLVAAGVEAALAPVPPQ